MKLVKVGAYVLLTYFLFIIGFYVFQEKFIFQGSRIPNDHQFDINTQFTEIFLHTSDSASIHGVLLKADSSKGVILYFHGNRQDITRWGNLASYFTQYNYDVLVMDYRGYGKSTGKRTEALLYSDAELAYGYLRRQYKQKDIIIYGRSLGTGLATKLASEVKAKNLILETPYHNFREMIFSRLKVVPKRLIRYGFNSTRYISKVSYPVYIFHGTDDAVIPLEYGWKLARAGNPDLMNMIVIENGGHNNLTEFPAYNKAMRKVLK